MALSRASGPGMGDSATAHNHTAGCVPLRSPTVGTLRLVSGDGVSVGTVMSLQCPVRHRPIGDTQMSCVFDSDIQNSRWSGGTAECRPLSRLEDEGFRLALLMAFISTVIILIMSIIFITSCLVRHVRREERKKMERTRKSGASEFWQDVEVHEVERETLHQQKTINNNNNNNNNINKQHTGRSRATDSLIYNHSDGYRYVQLYPQNLHPQLSLVLHENCLMNTHLGPMGLSWDGCTCRPEPLWMGQNRPPLPVMSV